MRVTTPAFGAMTMALRRLADECCDGRLVLVSEGGYDLKALDASFEAAVGALSCASAAPAWPAEPSTGLRGRMAVDAVKAAHSRFWQLG
jgi:acetoin utilization deacetylase AcuC-like enzyme